MESGEFEELVARSLSSLPHDFRDKLENLEVEVRDFPSADDLQDAGVEGGVLLGLYRGVPLGHRGYHYQLVLPDTIYIYRKPVEEEARRSGTPVVEVVRRVVLHEIAHHFGIPDSRLKELGY